MKENYDELSSLFDTVLKSNVSTDETGDKNFLEMGGDSIKAMHLIVEARKMGYDISMEDIMSKESIEELFAKGKFNSQELWKPYLEGTQELTEVKYEEKHTLVFEVSDFSEALFQETISLLRKQHDLLRATRTERFVTILPEKQEFDCTDQHCFDITHEPEGDKEKIIVRADANLSDYQSLQLLFADFSFYYSSLMKQKTAAEKEKTAPYFYWQNIRDRYRRNYRYFHNMEQQENTFGTKEEQQKSTVRFEIGKNISLQQIFQCYQQLVSEAYPSQNSWKLNFYNANRYNAQEMLDFSDTIGNFSSASQYEFWRGALLDYEELFAQNNYYSDMKTIDFVCGFAYYPAIEKGCLEYCTLKEITCTNVFDETIFLKVFEHAEAYTLELIGEACGEELKEKLLSKISSFPVSRISDTQVGNVGGNARDKAVLLARFGKDNVERIYRLLDVQKGMLFHSLEKQNNDEYKMQYQIHIGFYMDVELVEEAIRILAKKHPALRTLIAYKNLKEPMQVVLKNRVPVVEVIDVAGEITDDIISQYVERDLKRALDLEETALFSVTILNNYKELEMIWNFHHILADGWSMPIIFGDFHQYYEMLLYGEDIDYTVSSSYERYINRLYSKDICEGLHFWKEYLSDYEEDTTIMPLGEHTADAVEKKKYTKVFGTHIREKIQQLAGSMGTTFNTVMELAIGIVLQKYNCSEDIVFGKVVSGRDLSVEGTTGEAGLFVNTLPVRITNQDNTIKQLLEKIKENDLKIAKYEYCSLAQIIKEIGHNPVKILYAYENFMNAEMLMQDSDEIVAKNLRDDTNYDITFIVNNTKELEWNIVYDAARYSEGEMERLTGCIEKVLSVIPESLNTRAADMDIISEADAKQILDCFNNTAIEYPRNKSVGELFEEAVRAYKDNCALRYYDEQISYEQLNEMADGCVCEFRNAGVRKGDHICIMAHKEIKTIAYMIATLKIGAVYIPIDPQNPKDRIDYIIENSDTAALIDCKGKNKFFSREQGELPGSAEDTAYMMYTSGTSGEPKAVMVNHRGIVRLVKNTNYMQLDNSTCILQGSSLAFDASTLEIWGALLNGGTLCILDSQDVMDADRLDQLSNIYGINTMWLTCALFNQLMDQDPSILQGLKVLAIGGEKISEKHANQFLQTHSSTILLNGYGPTENTTFTTVGEIHKNERITIGRPVANTTVYIMNHNNLCPVGVYGELCTGGDGVAEGYYKDKELSRKSFVQNPFGKGLMYRTKDKARWLENGEIEFLGRMDHQVKIRGFRIEPEEISKTIEQIEGIRQCVTVIDDEKKIKSYYVSEQDISPMQIYKLLGEKLPDYMVPKYYLRLEKIPVTVNGKVDYRKLPKIQEPIKRQYVQPQNPEEERMADIFGKVLSVEKIGMDDDFVELGGNSLLAVRLANEMEEAFGNRVELRHIMSERTPAKILRYVKNHTANAGSAIPAADVKDVYEMSSVQKRMFMLQKMNPESMQYNIPILLRFQGHADVEKLASAVRELVKRHEALRTCFVIENKEFYQKIAAEDVIVNVYDKLSFEEAKGVFFRPFRLEQELPFRAGICVEEDTYLLMDVHHIVADGVSTTIMMREILTLYGGGELPLPEYQYKDYSEWLQNHSFEREKQYWMNIFQDQVLPLDIPCDYERKSGRHFEGETIQEVFRSEEIKYIANKCGVTEYVVFLAAWFILLNRYSRQEDITIGTPVAGRMHAEMEQTVGMFVNTLPLRVQEISSVKLEEFIKSLSVSTYDAFENQEYPLYELLEALQLPRDFTRQPLFDVIFAVRDQREEMALAEFGVEALSLYNNTAKFDLSLEVQVYADYYQLNLEYSTELFKEETVRRMLQNYICTLHCLKEHLAATIEEIEIIHPEEKKLILQKFNDTVAPYESNACIQEIFEKTVQENLSRTALIDGGRSVTYQEADRIANEIAVYLRAEGVVPNDVVAVEAQKNADTILLILGIIKAGAVYVPVEPMMPLEKISYMLQDSKAKMYIGSNQEKLQDIPVAFHRTEDVVAGSIPDSGYITDNHYRNRPEDCVYYMYTSGTTGQPKAAMVTHRNILRLVRNTNYVHLGQDTRMILTGSLAFDASTLEIWGALLNGGKLYIASNNILVSNTQLRKYIHDNGINTMWLTSSLFNQMIETDHQLFHELKYLMIGGEKLSDYHVRLFKQHNQFTKLINGYGPTENTTFTTTYLIPDEFEKIYIGKPVANTQVYIMQKNTLCGIGMFGELCAAGDGVAKGYLNNEELTREKFVPNPYGTGLLYRTGDLARFMPDGNVEYLGRADAQIKIRGFRVELSGIEQVMEEYPGIRHGAVIASPQKELKAYYVADTEIDSYELFVWLKAKLPAYMVPSYYLQLDSMPLTTNGKLDYKRLPENNQVVKTSYVAPANEKEKMIAKLYEDLLSVSEVGAEDHFFEMGGHSLKATLLCNQLEARFGVAVSVSDIFTNPTVRQLAEFIDRAKEETNVLMPAPEKDYYEASSAQKRIYFACQMNRNALLYNMPMFFECTRDIDINKAETAFQELIHRHETLRTVYTKIDGTIYQQIIPPEEILFAVETVSRDSFVRPFDLTCAPMIRVGIAEEEGRKYLCMDVHHIASDGFGMTVLMGEFLQLYGGGKLAPCMQYHDYSEWMQTRDISEQRQYWMSQYEDDIPMLNLLTDNKRDLSRMGVGKSCQIMIPDELSDKMSKLAQQFGMTEYMLYLSVSAILLGKYSYSEEFVIGTVMANRTNKQLEGIVGMFANTVALRVAPKQTDSISEFFRKMRTICVDAIRNQEYPYDLLVNDLKLKRDPAHNPLFDVMFVYQVGLMNREMESQGLNYVDTESPVAKFDLTININRTDHLYIKMEYDCSLYKAATMERMLNAYIRLMEELTHSADQKLSELSLITDRDKDSILQEFNPEIAEVLDRQCIHQMFEEQAGLHPDKTAIAYGDTMLTYENLNKKADRVAGKLAELGIEKGDFVCVMAHRVPETVIGLLGIMKAGAVYVPVDPAWPADRKQFVLEDCKAKLCLGKEADNTDMPMKVWDIGGLSAQEGVKNSGRESRWWDVAYCIYTSGTSGMPKGVLVSHEGVWSLREYFKVSQDIQNRPRSLQFASFAFDASVSELCMGILSGNTMVMISDEMKYDAKKLGKFLKEHQVDIGIIPPQYLELMEETGLQTVISAGSETNPEIVRKHCKNAVYSNDYGPTETTVCATYWKYDGISEIPYRIPIGKPIYNKNVYIMNCNKLCGIQVPGEICVAGDGIAVGYLNRPELTEERFISNPFGTGRLYRTGDLGRWNEDGNIEYLGRIDSQIKIRGFRVEPAEIENVLLKLEGIDTAVVIPYKKGNGDAILIAFYAGVRSGLTEADIKLSLAQSLPNYMIPSKILPLESIPVNTSGKVNRRRLIELYQESLTHAGENVDYSNWTMAQKLVKSIWEEVLEEEITDIDTDFFDMGGNSLNLFSVADKLETNGVIVAVSDLYQYSTVQLLASQVVEEQLSGEEVIELKPIQNEVVFVSGLHENKDSFSWSDVNCYYKPRAMSHGKYHGDYYSQYLMLLSFCSIYQVDGLFSSFHMASRQGELEAFEKKFIDGLMATSAKSYGFDELPAEEVFNSIIMEELRKDRPVIVAGNSEELYYSEDYMKMPHAHYFLLKGFNERKRLWHILDTLQNDFGAEPKYREFVITFDMLYNCVLSYKEKLTSCENEAYMVSVGGGERFSGNPDGEFLEFFRNMLRQMNDRTLPYSYIDISFMQYLAAHREELLELEEDARIEQLSYTSSLINMRPVFFTLLEELMNRYDLGQDVLDEFTRRKEQILQIWKESKILIWDVLNGQTVDMNHLQQLFGQGVEQEEVFRRMTADILECAAAAKEDTQEVVLKDGMYLENPLNARMSLQEDGFVAYLSDECRYDMWSGEINAVRVGKKYVNTDFFIEADIQISFTGNEIYQDGIAIHFDDRTCILFGPVITDKKVINIFYPSAEEYSLYEEAWDGETVRLRVESAGEYLVFKLWRDGVYKTVKRMKPQGKVQKAELFSRTWEKFAHTARFNNIRLS